MKKSEYIEKYGLILRKADRIDHLQADTDYGRNAEYIILCKSHIAERWSSKGTLQDLKEYVKDFHIKQWKYVH